MSWEDTFHTWGAAPSATEQQKMEHAETAIRKAIKANDRLAAMDITVIPQGSYRSRTNVRLDSDVDIAVRLNSTFFDRYPEGKGRADYGNSDGSITFREFRNLVHVALANELKNLKSNRVLTDTTTPYRTALSKATTMLENPLSIWNFVDVNEKHRLFFYLFDKNLSTAKKMVIETPKNQAP